MPHKFLGYVTTNKVSGIALQDIKILMTGLGYLKGPKLEIFDSGVFSQIRPVWVGDLGTRPKIHNWGFFGFFGLVSKSPTHTGLISRLGPFKGTLE